jgi:hypothetical protein
MGGDSSGGLRGDRTIVDGRKEQACCNRALDDIMIMIMLDDNVG